MSLGHETFTPERIDVTCFRHCEIAHIATARRHVICVISHSRGYKKSNDGIMRYTDLIYPWFSHSSFLTIPQLHPAREERRSPRLHNTRLPVPLLASPHRCRYLLLPLQTERHPPLHRLLDPATRRRYTPDRCAVGLHSTMAQLEVDMDCTGFVYCGWRY